MKRFFLLIIGFTTALFVGCEVPELPTPQNPACIGLYGSETREYSYETNVYTIDYSINYISSQQRLIATANCGWINHINTNKYGEFTFVLDENTTSSSRTGKITLNFEDATKVITIIQNSKPIPPKIDIAESIQIEAYGVKYGYVNYSIENCSSSQNVYVESTASWLSLVDTSEYGELCFCAEPNTTTSTRYADITLSYKGVTKVVKVEQYPAYQVLKCDIIVNFPISDDYIFQHQMSPSGWNEKDGYCYCKPNSKYYFVTFTSSEVSEGRPYPDFFWWSGDYDSLDTVAECGYYYTDSNGGIKRDSTEYFKGVYWYHHSNSSLVAIAYTTENGTVVIYTK